MKKLISLTLLAGFILLTPMFQGCGTPGSSAHKTEGITLPSINLEMDRWKAHVLAAKATQKQMDSVKASYNDYYATQLKAKSAEVAWITASDAAKKSGAAADSAKADAAQSTFVSATAAASIKAGALTALIEGYMHSK